MRQWLAIVLLLLCVTAADCVCADGYEIDDGNNGYYVCEDFDGELSVYAEQIFGGLMHEGDEVICGTLFEEHYRNQPDLTGRGAALLAVRRDGKILLMGADRNGDKNWHASVETDRFLPPDAAFSITCEPMGTKYISYVHLALTVGDEVFALRTQFSGALYLYEYRRKEADGSVQVIDCYGGSYRCTERRNGEETTLHAPEGGLPIRLCAWTLESFPDTPQKIDAWLAINPMDEPDDVGYIFGSVNLREKPTGQSRSWGQYAAKVKILEKQPGREVPWFRVSIGDLEGWVSGAYLRTQRAARADEWADSVNTVLSACRTTTETTLLRRPNGAAVQTIPEGAMLHVIAENDGWLHVILPRSEISWKTDWDGTYGFIPAKDAVVGISIADAVGK
ncbi:MAG: SH3 domain-containing protein [Clostridia bacterium]|nr:SH3 domain-containing protein [Clostridia bacterium]